MEGDAKSQWISKEDTDFNPLPPCGGRLTSEGSGGIIREFQSTPSVWRETYCVEDVTQTVKYFNPLPPCGGRRLDELERVSEEEFQSTPSVWRETIQITRVLGKVVISIHSLRVEGDLT